MRRHRVRMASLAAPGRYSFVGGPFGSKLTSTDYVAEGVRVIRGANMGGPSRFIDGDFVFVSDSKADTLLSNMAYPGDLVFTQRGTLGQIALVPPATDLGDRFVVSQSQMKLTVDPTTADPRYLYYYFTSAELIEELKARAITSGVPHINLTILRDFEVELPDIGHQCRIADILSAYDDLIENNNRRMALLEESIHLLYREWFVYLRFPGHERVEAVDGVPEGWSFTSLEDLCVEDSGVQTGPFGSQLHRSDYTDEGVPVVMPKQMKGNVVTTEGIARIPPTLANRLARHLVEEGDILYARRGDITRRVFVSSRERGWFCGTGCLRLRPKADVVEPRFLFEALGTARALAAIHAQATGATMLNLSAKAMKRVAVLMPPKGLQADFTGYSRLVKAQVEGLQEQNQKLREARDLLLPRLMDGRIPV